MRGAVNLPIDLVNKVSYARPASGTGFCGVCGGGYPFQPTLVAWSEHLVNSSCQGISPSSVPPPFVERSRVRIVTSARLHFSIQQSNKFIAIIL